MFGKNKTKKSKFSSVLSKLLCNNTTPERSQSLQSKNISFGFCEGGNADNVEDFDTTIKKLNRARNNCAVLREE